MDPGPGPDGPCEPTRVELPEMSDTPARTESPEGPLRRKRRHHTRHVCPWPGPVCGLGLVEGSVRWVGRLRRESGDRPQGPEGPERGEGRVGVLPSPDSGPQ